MADELTGYLVQEITVRGVSGRLLVPLTAQFKHDMTHSQGQRIEGIFDRLDNGVRKRAGSRTRYPC